MEEENLNLADLDLKKLKLSDEDALALSYLTPGLSKRIQKQLLAQLAPSEARKLHRTLSSRNSSDNPYENKEEPKFSNRSMDRLSSTLPRRYSADRANCERKCSGEQENAIPEDEQVTENKSYKSFLPVKSQMRADRRERRPYSDFSVRSASIEYEPSYRRPKVMPSVSLREPRITSKTYDTNSLHSPDSSISESISQNDSSSCKRDTDSDLSSKMYSFDNYSSLQRPSSYTRYSSENNSHLNRYLSPTKAYETSFSSTPISSAINKTELQRPSSTRRVSRFLRPDFFDPPKEENVIFKEKKEREMETQKVLKEIRDKRKNRLNIRRERSKSREKSLDRKIDSIDVKQTDPPTRKSPSGKLLENKSDIMNETNELLNNVSNNIKKLESNVSSIIHDYVNVPSEKNTPEITKPPEVTKPVPDYVNVSKDNTNNTNIPVVKKEKVSKIARPKSYPVESSEKNKVALKVSPDKETKISPEKDSRISRLRKGFVRQGSKEREKTKEDKNEPNKNNIEEKGHKNKLLQTLEKKLERFRTSTSTAPKETEEMKALKDKKSSVENAIAKLREQSLPRNFETCTESGLIKRAVSVEDLSNFSGNRPLQASRKSVTKILGLFKKYEEQDSKKQDKLLKKKKVKENGKNDDSKSSSKIKKASDKKSKESVIPQNSTNSSNNEKNVNFKEPMKNPDNFDSKNLPNDKLGNNKPERPRSLLLDKMRHFQQTNGAKSDTTGDKESKARTSKLPLNTFRQSLNLDSVSHEPQKFYKPMTKTSSSESQLLNKNNSVIKNEPEKPVDRKVTADRRNLTLDLSKIPSRNMVEPKIFIEPTPSTSGENTKEFIPPENRNSLTTTDDSSVFLSPCEDNISDSWSVCSDYHSRDLYSPVSPNGHLYSGDEGESVIDRIRRKSFYTRFNENKRTRRPSLRSYKDLDLYKDIYKSPTDYGSLDRRSFGYHKPVSRRSSFASSMQEPKDYKSYARSSSVLNDYINVPNRYQCYSSKLGRSPSHLYSDSEDNTLDDYLSAAKSRKYSTHMQPSRLGRQSVSPANEQYFVDHPSSSAPSNLASPTSPEPV